MWKTYILKSLKKRWYYVGSTNRIGERVLEHNSGKVLSTKLYKPFILIFSKSFDTEKEAREYEQKIKKCRREKEIIIKQFESGIACLRRQV